MFSFSNNKRIFLTIITRVSKPFAIVYLIFTYLKKSLGSIQWPMFRDLVRYGLAKQKFTSQLFYFSILKTFFNRTVFN